MLVKLSFGKKFPDLSLFIALVLVVIIGIVCDLILSFKDHAHWLIFSVHTQIRVLLMTVKDFNPESGDPAYTMGIVDLLLECVELSYRQGIWVVGFVS